MKFDKVFFERFPSIDSLVRTNKTRLVNELFKEKEKGLSSEIGSKRFTGTKSYQEAENLLVNGWDEHTKELKGGENRNIQYNARLTKRKPTTGVIGYVPNVPNAILGLPNSMISAEKVRQKVKAVTLVYSICVSSSWSTNQIIECGKTVINLIRFLETSVGVRVKLAVEIVAVSTSLKSGSLACLWVDIKDWRDGLDIKKLAFPMVHPSMLRRIGFKWIETFPHFTVKEKDYAEGYGYPATNGNYGQVTKELKSNGVLKDGEFYLTAQLCRECRHDVNKIMEVVGLTKFKNQRSA